MRLLLLSGCGVLRSGLEANPPCLFYHCTHLHYACNQPIAEALLCWYYPREKGYHLRNSLLVRYYHAQPVCLYPHWRPLSVLAFIMSRGQPTYFVFNLFLFPFENTPFHVHLWSGKNLVTAWRISFFSFPPIFPCTCLFVVSSIVFTLCSSYVSLSSGKHCTWGAKGFTTSNQSFF